MFTEDQLHTFKATIDAANTIAIFGHHNIDADAIGSVLGFSSVLEKIGKCVACFTTQPPSNYFSFVPGIEKIQTPFKYEEYDLIIFLDFTGYSRITGITKWHEDYFDKHTIVVVDHHIPDENMRIAPESIILNDPEASSCCELLLDITNHFWPETIDRKIATYWYMGVLTDTGSFQFSKRPIETFSHAITLIEKWADKEFLIRNLFNHNPHSLLDFMKMVTPRIQFTWTICSVWYTDIELTNLGISQDQAESFMIYIRSIYGAGVFAEITLRSTMIRCSLRAGYTDAGRYNVQKIAAALGGWGHTYAAWCAFIPDPTLSPEQQVSHILTALDEKIQLERPTPYSV